MMSRNTLMNDELEDRARRAATHFARALRRLPEGPTGADDPTALADLEAAVLSMGAGSLPDLLRTIYLNRAQAGADYSSLVADLRQADLLSLLREQLGLSPDVERARAGPAVTVIIRTFNRPQRLHRCLSSLCSQTRTDFDVVVVNDAGEDVSDVVGRFDDLDVRLLTHTWNQGRTAALNTGLECALGDYVLFLDDDDLLLAGHIELLVREADRLGGEQVVYSRALAAHENPDGVVLYRRLEHAQTFDHHLLLVTNYIPILTALVPRKLAEAVGGFDVRLQVLEDWDWFIRLAERVSFHHLPVITCEYRIRETAARATTREPPRFDAGLRYVYEKHPVPPDSDVGTARQHFLESSAHRATAFPFEVSFILMGGTDVQGLAKTVESIIASSGEGKSTYELIVDLPRDPAVLPFARQLEGQVSISYRDTVAWSEDEVEAGRRRAAGRVRVLVEAGTLVGSEDFHRAATAATGDEWALGDVWSGDSWRSRSSEREAPVVVTHRRPNVVVTGAGRSGTGYMAALLTSMGLACGHELVFNPWTDLPFFGNLQGDASWLAIPFVADLAADTIVVHQIRNPLDFLRSSVGIHMLTDPGPYLDFIGRHWPWVLGLPDDLTRSLAYWVTLNQAVERFRDAGRPYIRSRLEDLDENGVLRLARALDLDKSDEQVLDAYRALPGKVNARQRDESIRWGDIPASSLRDEAAEMARRYGYEVPRLA